MNRGHERALRLWHITESYPPQYGGGAGLYVRDICETLASRGHDVRVLCTEDSDRPAYSLRAERINGVHVERMSLPYFRRVDFDGLSLGLAAWREHERRVATAIGGMVAAWRPNLVNYHATRPLGEAVFFALADGDVPVVATLHEAWIICQRVMLLQSPQARPCAGPSALRCLECMYSHYDRGHTTALVKSPWRLARLGPLPAYRIWRRARARQIFRGAFAYSRFMADHHARHLRGPVRYIPLGINLAGVPAPQPDRPRTPFRFGFMGGGQPTKGLVHVLEAARRLRDDGLKFELHVWGPLEDDAAREVRARDLSDQVFVRGLYDASRPWDPYVEIDLAIMATMVAEPFGRIVPEAAATGAPAIGPAVGGIGESIRDGVDGLLYRFRDAGDLERQMRRILVEPGLYERLAANVRPVRDTREAVSDVERFYYDILEGADA